MASTSFPEDLDDFDSSVIENPATRKQKGFCTSAGRGRGDFPKLTPLMKGMQLAELNVGLGLPVPRSKILPSRMSELPAIGLGRANMLKTVRMNWDLEQERTSRQGDNCETSEIHTQLRQALGSGYSTDFLEDTYAPKTQAISVGPPNEASDQYNDADQEESTELCPNLDWIDEECSKLLAKSPAKGTDNNGHSKKKGKKGRVFRRVLTSLADPEPSAEASGYSCSGDIKKKTISHIFEEKPDYLRSYFSRKKDPFVLHSKDDFPAL